MTVESTDKIAWTEMVDTLTGWEEMGLARATGVPYDQLVQGDQIKYLRGLVAVSESRASGETLKVAYDRVMSWPFKKVNEYFAQPADDEIDPDEPESPEGKGASPDA